MVDYSMRLAAFVVGFECCRRLILGELDLEAVREQAATKGGAE